METTDTLIFVAIRPETPMPGMLDLADSNMLHYITPSLGPTSTLVLFHAAVQARSCVMNSARFVAGDMAHSLGVQMGMLIKSLKRLTIFGLLTPSVYIDNCWDMPTHIVLPSRWLDKIPLSTLKG